MKKLIYFSLILLLGLSACKKDDLPNPDPTPDPDPQITYVNGSVRGIVLDEVGLPISNAEITLQYVNGTYSTDQNGYFKILNKQVNKDGAYLKITKSGYFTASRTFLPTNKTNVVQIQLLEATIIGSVDDAGGEVSTSDGAKILLPANAAVRTDGTAYTGTIDVAAKWLDPEAENVGLMMPGNLSAKDKDGNEVTLATAGMLAVELLGSAGEKLQLADGKEATLTFPLSTEMSGAAPSTIPLWYFDEVIGTWVEEGEATLQGGTYVGNVSHFTFWNCDIPFDAVTLDVTVLDADGEAVEGIYISLSVFVDGEPFFGASGMTNADGIASGFVPQGELFLMEVFSNWTCDPILTQNIGPFDNDASITVTIPAEEITTVSGTLVDCDNNPLSNAYVIVSPWEYGGGTIIEADASGNFSTNVVSCPDEVIYVQAYDISSVTGSEVYAIDVDGTDLNVGNLLVCEDLVTFINLEVDGDIIFTPQAFSYAYDSLGMGEFSYAIYSNDQGASLEFNAPENAALGTYDIINFYAGNYTSWETTSMDIETTVTEMGVVGEYIGGTLDGTFVDVEGGSHTISGTYRALRQ